MNLIIANTAIRTDAEGRYCLNDLHKAAGNEKRHQPSDWLSLQQTSGLIAEISNSGDSRSCDPTDSKAGRYGGTYVCKELVYAYAMWISPKFHLQVIRAYDAMTTKPEQAPASLSRLQLIELAMQAEQERLALEVKATALEAKVTEQAPKVEALDRITIADGRLNLTNTAKNLDIQPHKLTKWMNENHWIYRRVGGGGWVAYQDKIQSGYLTHKIYVATREDGTEKTCEQVMVLPKGLAKLSMLVPVGGGRPPQGDLGLGVPAQ